MAEKKPHANTFFNSLWDACDPDIECISAGLNQENHYDERYVEHLYMHTPLLQELPDDLDETWRHGVLWTGGHGQKRFELARNYRCVAEKILEQALESGEPRDLICPVLFAYRHTLELYLKSLGEVHEHTHSLTDCVKLVEKRYGKKFGARVKSWIQELDKIDPHPGTTFRYEDDRNEWGAEYWVDLRQFKFVMGKLFQMVDMAVLNDWGSRKGGP